MSEKDAEEPSDYEKLVRLESLVRDFDTDIQHADRCLYRLLEAGFDFEAAESILRATEVSLPPEPDRLRIDINDVEKQALLVSLINDYDTDLQHVDKCLFRLLDAGVDIETAESILRERDLELPPEPHRLRRAANKVEKRVSAPRDEIERAVFGPLSSRFPVEEAVSSAVKSFDRTFNEYGYYEPFDEWSGEYPLPKIDSDDWVPIWDSSDSERLQELGEELQGRYRHVVYCLVCDIQGASLPAARRRAERILDTEPKWLEEAYDAKAVFYIGETEDLSWRLRTHAVGRLSDSPPPAHLTRISEIATVGVVSRPSEREKARNIEELYAENLQQVLGDEYYVHYGQDLFGI